ncbi:type II secretion system protein [Magnetococcus marinus MC-1]|uniref:Type II secretion system protein n=1 Tax=Magnetococcus marinus (strain ATCC BAA-1437 / JCM 17883 / MC-1) TaxID=156889 RepID=A0L657_MAGMM|nr:type II secretion system F family protein [Magnetococcus marinus]ABK43450.1 type II secretion system protein [Magnetococcus marinus MC-1]
MAYFYYKYLSKDGPIATGLIDLPYDNPISATTYLEQQGHTVIVVNPLSPFMGALAGLAIHTFEKKVTMEELAEGLTNMAVMLKAGIPLITCLKDTIADHDNSTLSKVGQQLVMRVEGGSSLAEALAAYPRYFPDTLVFLVRLGEETGSLDQTVRDAAAHTQKMDKIRRDTKSALTYPTFMFVAIFGAMFFWIYLVVPPMADMFKQFQLDLPVFTKMVIDGSVVIKANVGMIFGVLLGTIFTLVALVKSSAAVRKLIQRILMKTPIFKVILTAFNLAFITQYMSMMLRAGVDVMRTLQVLKEAIPNEIYREHLDQVQENLVSGIGLRESFDKVGIFPNFVVRMIGVGEQSGTLSEQLEYIAEDYRVKLDELVGNIGKLVEPIAIVVGGGLFIALAMALFAPLYQLIKNI